MRQRADRCAQNRRGEGGSVGWARTSDPRINSPLLYRLSYDGTGVGTEDAHGARPERVVEPRGVEPLTSCMPCKRSPN